MNKQAQFKEQRSMRLIDEMGSTAHNTVIKVSHREVNPTKFKDYISELQDNGEMYKHFMDEFVKVYDQNEKDAERNKKSNNIYKKLYIASLALIPVFLAVVSIIRFIMKLDFTIETSGMTYLVCVFIPLFCSYAFARLLDVKRYQETWARRRLLQVLMFIEARKYYGHIGCYTEGDPQGNAKCFVEKMLTLQEENIQRFYSNMSEKEKSLTDMPGFFK